MTRDELLRAWVDALEGGKYQQGRAGLHFGERYCCLGVLCDVSDAGTWSGDGFFESEQFGSRGILLPALLREYVGLSSLFEKSLANDNDHGVSFQKIARRIRREFPEVFASVPA